jgi:hypothetical protein
MKKRGRPIKEFQEYIIEPSGDAHVTLNAYVESPATAFLAYCIEAKDSIIHCQRHFQKNQDGSLSKSSVASLQHLSAAILPAIMGHFETYQRHLFAGIFEMSGVLKNFHANDFFSKLQKADVDIKIDPVKLAGYRRFSTTTGVLLADNLSGWHNPRLVNKYFRALLDTDIYDEGECKNLLLLWQLRHSIVHTGGSLSLPDAQKIPELMEHGRKPLAFDDTFIMEVSKKFHPLVKNATSKAEKSFKGQQIRDGTTRDDQRIIDKLFMVKSKVPVWFN